MRSHQRKDRRVLMALTSRPETEKLKLKQCGKKSFWVLAALLLYSVISAVQICISTYSMHEPAGLSANDSWIPWVTQYIWPTLPRLACVFFALYLLPCVFYIIANTTKNAKVANAFLVCGLVYHVLVFLAVVLPNILFIYIYVIMILLFLLPLFGYLVLFYKATHGSK